MKYLITVLFAGLLFTSCSSVPTHSAPEKTVFFTKGFVVDDLGCLNKHYKSLELSCHRLEMGKNTIVGVREFRLTSDHHADRFKKLTVSFSENVKEGAVYEINNATKVFFSYGLTYGLGKVGCFGKAINGTINILSVDAEKLVIKLDVNFDMKSPLGWKGDCKIENYAETLTASYKPYDSLTAWDGVADEKSWGIYEARPPYNFNEAQSEN